MGPILTIIMIAIAAIWLAGGTYLCFLFIVGGIPRGYEDETGFHFEFPEQSDSSRRG